MTRIFGRSVDVADKHAPGVNLSTLGLNALVRIFFTLNWPSDLLRRTGPGLGIWRRLGIPDCFIHSVNISHMQKSRAPTIRGVSPHPNHISSDYVWRMPKNEMRLYEADDFTCDPLGPRPIVRQLPPIESSRRPADFASERYPTPPVLVRELVLGQEWEWGKPRESGRD